MTTAIVHGNHGKILDFVKRCVSTTKIINWLDLFQRTVVGKYMKAMNNMNDRPNPFTQLDQNIDMISFYWDAM